MKLMKNLIKEALRDCMSRVERTIPKHKLKTVEVDLEAEDVEPINLLKFMEENNIPKNAYFSTNYCGTSISNYVAPVLCYEINVDLTEKDKEDYRKRRFNRSSFKLVYNILTKNNYKRTPIEFKKLKKFKTPYEMYIENDFDKLVEYYSLYFKKE